MHTHTHSNSAEEQLVAAVRAHVGDSSAAVIVSSVCGSIVITGSVSYSADQVHVVHTCELRMHVCTQAYIITDF